MLQLINRYASRPLINWRGGEVPVQYADIISSISRIIIYMQSITREVRLRFYDTVENLILSMFEV